MSVSHESAAGSNGNGRRRNETKREFWQRVRYRYETTDISQRDLADDSKVPRSTLFKRAMREKWTQRAKLVARTAHKLEAQVDDAIRQEVRDELAPYIEEKKREITKAGYGLAARGMGRVTDFMDSASVVDAKTEAYISKAAQTYVSIGRTSLGMNDGTPAGGSLNLNILTNQAAVQVVAHPG